MGDGPVYWGVKLNDETNYADFNEIVKSGTNAIIEESLNPQSEKGKDSAASKMLTLVGDVVHYVCYKGASVQANAGYGTGVFATDIRNTYRQFTEILFSGLGVAGLGTVLTDYSEKGVLDEYLGMEQRDTSTLAIKGATGDLDDLIKYNVPKILSDFTKKLEQLDADQKLEKSYLNKILEDLNFDEQRQKEIVQKIIFSKIAGKKVSEAITIVQGEIKKSTDAIDEFREHPGPNSPQTALSAYAALVSPIIDGYDRMIGYTEQVAERVDSRLGELAQDALSIGQSS